MNVSVRNTRLQRSPKSNTLPKFLKLGLISASSMAVGGQAVIEGVMMRSPHSMAVAVRKPNKKIVIKEFEWVSFATKFPFLKKPFLRGMTILVEAMMNGMHALSFSAEQAGDEADQNNAPLTKAAIVSSMIVAFGAGIGMFVVLPHLLTDWFGRVALGGLAVNTFAFHALDGVIKMTIFVLYILAISRMPDIRRVFQYHGAEHKSIFAYEHGKDLIVDNAQKESRFHPRCGTSFIFTIILASIFIFSAVFPMLPKPSWNPIVTSIAFALIKIPLMLPIVACAYEFIRFMGSEKCPTWLRGLSAPGLWMQNLTTREPDVDQLEVGLASLKACLWREENLATALRKKESLIEFENITSPTFEERLAQVL